MLISTDCRFDLPFKFHNVPLCFKTVLKGNWRTLWLPVEVIYAKCEQKVKLVLLAYKKKEKKKASICISLICQHAFSISF